MKSISVIIGANFGDEGKGLITDYLCARSLAKCLNVLTNGGAQRAHTVDTKDGQHHVFQHFGSGTFAGADTFFSWRFIINPMQFHKEYDELSQKIIMPKVYCDALCTFTTPWDMMVNQIVEESRGDKKHGSCGMGIWETIVRSRSASGRVVVTIGDFNSLPFENKNNYLRILRDNYFVNRLKDYAINEIPDNWKDIWFSDTLISNFIYDIDFFVKHTISVFGCIKSLFDNYDCIIFENGQGLLLDQHNLFYGEDSTTPSNTGSLDAFNLINSYFKPNEVNVELCYVSRTYMTRHGNGRFETENTASNILTNYIIDQTNVANQFQGSLRYGELIEENLKQRIINDSKRFTQKFPTKVSVYLTHTNEFMCDVEKIKSNDIDNIFVSDTKYRDSVKLF